MPIIGDVRKLTWPQRLLPLAALILMSACSSMRMEARLTSPSVFEKTQSIAVLPFDNLTPFPEAGAISSDLFASELRGWQGLKIYERNWMADKLRTAGGVGPDRWTRAHAAEYGRRFGADAVAMGSVQEFGYVREQRGLTEIAAVAYTVQIVATSTGRVVWSGSVQHSGGNDLNPGRPPLNMIASEALGALIGSLFAELAAFQIENPDRGGMAEEPDAPPSDLPPPEKSAAPVPKPSPPSIKSPDGPGSVLP